MGNEKINGIWTKWIQAILLPLLVAFFSTWLAFYFFQQKHDEEIVKLTAKYAHFQTIINKQIEYTEKIINSRRDLISLLERLKLIGKSDQVEARNLFVKGLDSNKETKAMNAIASMYISMPFYKYTIHFDKMFVSTLKKYSDYFKGLQKYPEFPHDIKLLEKSLDSLIIIGRDQFINVEEFNVSREDYNLPDTVKFSE